MAKQVTLSNGSEMSFPDDYNIPSELLQEHPILLAGSELEGQQQYQEQEQEQPNNNKKRLDYDNLHSRYIQNEKTKMMYNLQNMLVGNDSKLLPVDRDGSNNRFTIKDKTGMTSKSYDEDALMKYASAAEREQHHQNKIEQYQQEQEQQHPQFLAGSSYQQQESNTEKLYRLARFIVNRTDL